MHNKMKNLENNIYQCTYKVENAKTLIGPVNPGVNLKKIQRKLSLVLLHSKFSLNNIPKIL